MTTETVEIEEQINLKAEAVLALERPAFFIKHVLGYKLYDCHRRWFRFQLDNDRTMLLAPRGHGKSTLNTVCYAIWKLLRNPNQRILIVSATDTLAANLLEEIRENFEKSAMIERFGDLRGEIWGKHRIKLKTRTVAVKEASLTAAGIKSTLISGHYDIILFDDLVDEKNAKSEILRQMVKTYFKKELIPCLEPGGEIHGLGTRWHPLELYQDILDLSDREKTMKAEEGEEIEPYEIIIDGAFQSDGSVLCPEFYSHRELEKRRRELGSKDFNMAYQNDVELAKGRVFRPEWITGNYIKFDELPKEAILTQAYDLAISKKTTSDYFASVTVAGTVAPGGKRLFYVVDAFHDRGITFEQQANLIERRYKEFMPERVGIECVAYQQAMVQVVEGRGIPVEGINPVKDKLSRAYRLAAYFENQQIRFLKTEPIMELVDELLLFPDGQHDDLFDALEMAVSMQIGGIAPQLIDLMTPPEEAPVIKMTKDGGMDGGFIQLKEGDEDKKVRKRIMEDDSAWAT